MHENGRLARVLPFTEWSEDALEESESKARGRGEERVGHTHARRHEDARIVR